MRGIIQRIGIMDIRIEFADSITHLFSLAMVGIIGIIIFILHGTHLTAGIVGIIMPLHQVGCIVIIISIIRFGVECIQAMEVGLI